MFSHSLNTILNFLLKFNSKCTDELNFHISVTVSYMVILHVNKTRKKITVSLERKISSKSNSDTATCTASIIEKQLN